MRGTAVLWVALAVGVTVAAGCGSDPLRPDASTGSAQEEGGVAARADTAFIGLGETVLFEGSGVAVSYLALEADSRCPVGLDCVWEGDAAVRLGVESTAERREVVLHTTLEPRALTVEGAVVELLDVLPRPVRDRPVEPSETRVLVRLTRS